MRRILESNPPRRFGLKTLILEPQSEIMNFRIFLRENGYEIQKEDFLLEDGKYYPVIKAHVIDLEEQDNKDKYCNKTYRDNITDTGIDTDIEISMLPDSYKDAIFETRKRLKDKNIIVTDSQLVRLCDRFGPCILLSGKADFKSFLVHGNEVCDTILSKIKDAGKSHQGRFDQVSLEQADIKMALHLF